MSSRWEPACRPPLGLPLQDEQIGLFLRKTGAAPPVRRPGSAQGRRLPSRSATVTAPRGANASRSPWPCRPRRAPRCAGPGEHGRPPAAARSQKPASQAAALTRMGLLHAVRAPGAPSRGAPGAGGRPRTFPIGHSPVGATRKPWERRRGGPLADPATAGTVGEGKSPSQGTGDPRAAETPLWRPAQALNAGQNRCLRLS